MQLTIKGEPMSITGSVVTADYFDVLSLQPAAGRFFGADEDQVPGRDHPVVISDALWQRKFARDSAVIGSTVLENGAPFSIVGVGPRGFAGVLIRGGASDVWIPSAMFKVGYRYCDAFTRGCTVVQVLGRLKLNETVAVLLSAFLAGPALLAIVALAASYWPARAASRIDPASALRADR